MKQIITWHKSGGGAKTISYRVRQILAALLAAIALPAQALTEVKWTNSSGGSFLEPSNWNGGALPVGGDSFGTVDLDVDYTVTFPDGGTANFSPQFKTPLNAAGATELKKLVLDFQGSFEWTDGESGNYQGEPFKFYSSAGHFFNWEGWNNKYGPAAVTNALVSLWTDKAVNNADSVHIHVSRGVFNMRRYMSDGANIGGGLIVGHVVPGNNALDVVFVGGASALFYNGALRLNASQARFAVTDGASVTFANDLDFPSSDGGTYRNVLEVSGEGSSLSVGNLRLLQSQAVNRDLQIAVTNGGYMSVGEFRQNGKGKVDVLVSDGGTLKIRTTGGDFMKREDSTINLCVTNNGTLELAEGGQWGWNQWNDACQVNLHTAGGKVWFSSGNFNWNRDWMVDAGTDVVVDGDLYLSSSVTNNALGITVDLSASGAHGVGRLRPGNNYPCKLVITNNVVDVKYAYAANQPNGTADILVGGTGLLRVQDFEFGNQGAATLTVRDEGVADVGYFRMGRSNINTDREIVVNIEGGRLVCTNSQINVCDATRICRINLTGGELYSRQTLGWNNAHYRDSNNAGWAAFVGNGGTLKAPPNSNANEFFGAFDDARIGANGLTVESDYTVGIRQQFADLGDENGTIVFTGTGTKRILATNWNGYTPGTSTHSYTVAAGGTLLFETGADWQTHLVVTNGATASTVGDCTGLTLKGLTLGDADTVGYLAVDASDVIVVDGPVSLPNGALLFNSAPANGTYALLQVNDPGTNFPAAERDAWSRMVIAGGAASGRSHRFVSSIDETTGVLTLSVVVADAAALSGSAVWTGAEGAAWATGDNWDGGAKPGESNKAVFSSEEAPAAVTLATAESVGAVEFSAEQSYTISGPGSLYMSGSGNESVTATAGSHEIAVPLSSAVPLPVVAAGGAKITLSGGTGIAGLKKLGDGNLTLTRDPGENLVVADGVVTFGGTNPLTLSKLTFQAASANRQIGLKADVPTTVSTFVPTAGLVVKGGTAPLVFESNANMNFAPANGPTDNDAVTSSYSFSETGPVPQKGAAVMVTEGNLTLKGTGDNPSAVRFNDVRNVMVGVRQAEGSADPSFTLDGAQINANKHTRIGTAYDKDGAFWKTASMTIDNGAYARFDTLFIGGDIGNVDLDNLPHIYVTVDHGSRISGWYRMDINNAGRSDRRPKTLVTMRIDNGSELVDYTGNIGVSINAPGADVTFDHGSIFGRQTGDWSAAVNPGRLTFGGDSFDDHVRFLNGSRFLCSMLYYNATADWATNHLHFADAEWFAGDDDFDFVFKNGHRIAVHAEGDGLKFNPPADRTWTMHTILAGTDVVKGGEGALVLDVAKYMTGDNASTTVDNPAATSTLAITGTLRVNEGTVRIADGAAVAGTCGLAVAEGAAVDLGGESVAFTTLSGAGSVGNGTLVDGVTMPYDADSLLTFDGVSATGKIKVDFSSASPLDDAAAKAGIVVGHYAGTAPADLAFGALNTGLDSMKPEVSFENGDIVMRFERTGFVILVR